MPKIAPLTLPDAMIRDLGTGALSIGVGLRIIEVLRDGGLHEAAAEVERRWESATSPREALPPGPLGQHRGERAPGPRGRYNTQIRRTPE